MAGTPAANTTSDTNETTPVIIDWVKKVKNQLNGLKKGKKKQDFKNQHNHRRCYSEP